MELSVITQSFCCWGKQSTHLFIYEIRIVFPHLHICLHQISSVILLPTQSSNLLLQLCTIIFAILNKWLTSYHQQTSLLTPLPCHIWWCWTAQAQYRFSCRIPLTISLHHEEWPFAPTVWFLSFNKLFIHAQTFPFGTWLPCFLKSFWRRPLLKAFWKFK